MAVLLGLSLTALAQTSRGTVAGTVTDPNNAVIAGANVTLTNTETGVSRTTVTNEEGLYRFDAVDLGTYSVKFNATNFSEVTKTGVEVRANQVSDVGSTLQPGSQQVTVDVTADAGQLLQTEAPVRGGNIEAAKITELPFAGRNPVTLAQTLPGVSSNRFGFGVGTFSVNGSRGRSNNFLIDGTENNDISVAGQAFQITNPDAVQEVSVQTSNFDAEFGRAGGAVVNVITKQGGNSFHGSLSYLLDSTWDDALTNIQALNTSAVTARKGHPPAGTEQWFSGTFGGPIVHERSFFFGAYQEQRQNSTSSFSRTVPTEAGVAKLRSIFPAGTNANVDTYLNVIGNVRGISQFINIALGPNSAGVQRGDVQFGTGFFSVPRAYIDRQIQLRLDHKLSEKDQLSGRYLYDNQFDPLASINFPGFETTQKNRYQNALISDTHVFSSTLTNELRLAYNRIKLGFPADPSNELGKTLPRFDVSQFTNFGIQTNLPQGRIANNYVVQDTMTYLRGNHTFRFGLDILDQRSRQLAPIVERGLLTYRSGGGFTALGNFVDNFGGSGGGVQRDFGSPKYYPFLIRQAYFGQDRWRVNQDLTLTLGLRYENFGQPINTLRTAAFTGLFNVNPATRGGPYAEPSKVDKDNNNFAPTIGLAYSPSYTEGWMGRIIGDRRTVIRMGYQIGYDSFFNNIASNAATSSPNVVATSINSIVSTSAPRGLANLSGSFPTTARPLSPLDSQTLVVKNLVNPYYQKWSIGIQRALPWNIVLDTSYVGNKGTQLFINEDLNPSVPAALRSAIPAGYPNCTPNANVTAAQATAQFPAGTLCPLSGRLDNLQGSRLIRSNGGSSIYHAGQLLLQRRFVNQFAMTFSYTYSKLIDNASEVFSVAETNQPQQASYPSVLGGQHLERAVSFFDRTHRASLTYVWGLPFFKGERGVVGRILGGWEFSGVATWESGVPLTVSNGQDADAIGGNLDRPDYNPNGGAGTRAVPALTVAATGTPTIAVANPCNITSVGTLYYTNPDAGNTCIDPRYAMYIGLLAGTGRRGNLGRNTLRSPGLNNWNMNILKRIRVTENTNLEFRTEFYNVFNHPQYGSGSISPFSGLPSGIAASVINSSAGRFLRPEFDEGGGRVIRYQFKFTF
jgi:hypothetical protein